MTGDPDDQDLAVDVAALTDDQRAGLACINCDRSGGSTRAIPTPANPRASQVVVHTDTEVCLRYIVRYITGLHLRLVDVAERTVAALTQADDATDP